MEMVHLGNRTQASTQRVSGIVTNYLHQTSNQNLPVLIVRRCQGCSKPHETRKESFSKVLIGSIILPLLAHIWIRTLSPQINVIHFQEMTSICILLCQLVTKSGSPYGMIQGKKDLIEGCRGGSVKIQKKPRHWHLVSRKEKQCKLHFNPGIDSLSRLASC